jgi:hypothetical protein
MVANTQKRIAILGLYNSGSTALAGMLHRLGVNMGSPFWRVSDENSNENFYEPYDISRQMRRWYKEPHLIDRGSPAERIAFFRDWITLQESKSAQPVGVKHPLLSLCASELLNGWGTETCFLWSWRNLEESVAGLQRRGWFAPEFVEPLQNRLWNSLQEFASRHPQIIRLDWNQVQSNPMETAQYLATLAGIHPSAEQLQSAAEFIHSAPRTITENPSTSFLTPNLPIHRLHVPRKALSIHQRRPQHPPAQTAP